MEMSCISSISFVNYYTDLLRRTGVRWGKKITTVVYCRVNIPICERLVLFVDQQGQKGNWNLLCQGGYPKCHA